ncbi:MAG: restriction endonuclease subunit S [Pseudohongiellaceae bacterium]
MVEAKDMPTGWSQITLGEAADYLNGRAFKSSEWKDHGLPIIRIQNLNDPNASFNYTDQEYEARHRIETGNLLFAWSASLGAYIWRNGSAWLNQHIFRVDPKPFVDKVFLFYFLNSIAAELYAQAHGSGMVHITKKKFDAIPMLLPPINEQRRTVAKIEELFSELDKGVESLKTARAQLKTYRQSLLSAAFEGRFSRESNHVVWPIAKFGNVLDYLTSGSRGWAKYYADQGDLFIRAQNLKNDKLDLSDRAYVSLPDKSEGKRTRVERGDLLVTITGANVTKAGLVEKELGNAYVSQHVALCRLNECLLPAFAYWYLMSELGGRKQLNRMAYGAGKPGLNLDNIKSMDIPIPGIESQRETVIAIEQKLAICTKLDSTLDVTIRKIEALRQSILKRAFEGKLVPQNPDDEPASVLLERIRQEQADAPSPKRRKRKTEAPA